MFSPEFRAKNRKKVLLLAICAAVGLDVIIASCLAAMTPKFQKSSLPPKPSQPQPQLSQAASQQWRPMTSTEEVATWESILNSPLGIAALNQLAIEGFISPLCPKTFYVNEKLGGFQSLLRIRCPDERGVSGGLGYNEIRVIFNRFESTVSGFEVERVSSQEGRPAINLPD